MKGFDGAINRTIPIILPAQFVALQQRAMAEFTFTPCLPYKVSNQWEFGILTIVGRKAM
jgi:hypothetical protein